MGVSTGGGPVEGSSKLGEQARLRWRGAHSRGETVGLLERYRRGIPARLEAAERIHPSLGWDSFYRPGLSRARRVESRWVLGSGCAR